MITLVDTEKDFSNLFIDYCQLWIAIEKEHFTTDLAHKIAAGFSSYPDGWYKEKCVRMNTSGNEIYINHSSLGINIRLRRGDARIQLSGTFGQNKGEKHIVKNQLVEIRELMRKFYLILENDKERLAVDKQGFGTGEVVWKWKHILPKSETEYIMDTSVSILHLAKNVYNRESWPLENLAIKAKSNMYKELKKLPYGAKITLARFEQIMEQVNLEEQKRINPQYYSNAGGEGVRAIYMGTRGRHTVQMLIYDKRCDEQNAHDEIRFGTVDFYRWEYRIGKQIMVLGGIHDLGYLDTKHIKNLWKMSFNRYMPLWGINRKSPKYAEAEKIQTLDIPKNLKKRGNLSQQFSDI